MNRLQVLFIMPGAIAHQAFLYMVDKTAYIQLWLGSAITPLNNFSVGQNCSFELSESEQRMKYYENDKFRIQVPGECDLMLFLWEIIILRKNKVLITKELVSEFYKSLYGEHQYIGGGANEIYKFSFFHKGNGLFDLSCWISNADGTKWYMLKSAEISILEVSTFNHIRWFNEFVLDACRENNANDLDHLVRKLSLRNDVICIEKEDPSLWAIGDDIPPLMRIERCIDGKYIDIVAP